MLEERIRRAVQSLHQIHPVPHPFGSVLKRRQRRRIAAGGMSIAAIAAAVGLTLAFSTGSQPRTIRVIAPTRSTVPSAVPSTAAPSTTTPATTTPTTTTTPPTTAAGGGWDIDGDGRPDSAHLTYLGPSTGPNGGKWQLAVTLTSLGQRTVTFDAAPAGFKLVGIVGAVDASHDGRGEIFVQINAGASTQTWTMFSLVDGSIKQVTVNGQPFTLGVNGTVTHQAGFSCNGADLITTQAGLAGTGSAYAGTVITSSYQWGNGTLTLISQHTTSAPTDITPYGKVACGDLPQYFPGPGQ